MFCFQVKNVQVNHDEQQLQCTICSSSILVQAFGFSGLRCGFSGMKSSDGVVWQLYFELNCKRKNFQEYYGNAKAFNGTVSRSSSRPRQA